MKTARSSGINVQVVNGLGATNGNPADPSSLDPLQTNVNGLGNLILGYNEFGNFLGDDRTDEDVFAAFDTSGESFAFDAIVFATGFDAMTGAIVAVDITGREGIQLCDKWAGGPKTYLGLTIAGFPNLFMVTGPQSPGVKSQMILSIEQHVDFISRCMEGCSPRILSNWNRSSTR